MSAQDTVSATKDIRDPVAAPRDFMGFVEIARDGGSFARVARSVRDRIGPAIRTWQREYAPKTVTFTDEALGKTFLRQASLELNRRHHLTNEILVDRLIWRIKRAMVENLVTPAMKEDAMADLSRRLDGV